MLFLSKVNQGLQSQWSKQAEALRTDTFRVPLTFKPWSSLPGLLMENMTTRRKEVLDLACISWLQKDGQDAVEVARSKTPAQMKDLCKDLFTDVSQNPARKCWTGKDNTSKCLTTSSALYCRKYDRLALPLELLRFQGHDVDVKLPPPAAVKQSDLHDLAGEGMNLACLATVVQALLVTDSLIPPL